MLAQKRSLFITQINVYGQYIRMPFTATRTVCLSVWYCIEQCTATEDRKAVEQRETGNLCANALGNQKKIEGQVRNIT